MSNVKVKKDLTGYRGPWEDILDKDDVWEIYQIRDLDRSSTDMRQRITYCTAQVDGSKHIIIKPNEYEADAEEKVIDELDIYFDQNPQKKGAVSLYANNSPQNKCADKLIEFQAKHSVTFSIKAVSVYNMGENYAGLRKLLTTEGITLNAFEESDWKALYNILKHSSISGELEEEGDSPWKPDEDMKRRDKGTVAAFANLRK